MPSVDLSSINIVDYLHVEGVKLVEPGMPQWKFKPLREKNLQLISEYLSLQEQENERKKEEAKWEAIPEWKRPLLREREKKKSELEEAQQKLEEAERKEREKFESLPDWKQRVLKKKKSISEHDTNSDTKSEISGHSEPTNGEEQDVTSNNGIQNNHSEDGKLGSYSIEQDASETVNVED